LDSGLIESDASRNCLPLEDHQVVQTSPAFVQFWQQRYDTLVSLQTSRMGGRHPKIFSSQEQIAVGKFHRNCYTPATTGIGHYATFWATGSGTRIQKEESRRRAEKPKNAGASPSVSSIAGSRYNPPSWG
jgi:hypothetical protein